MRRIARLPEKRTLDAKKIRLGTYAGIPPSYVTVLDGIRNRVRSGTNVVYAEGCRISEPDIAPNLNAIFAYKAPNEEADRKLIKEAVDTAGSADVIVLALGGNEAVSRESIGDMGPNMEKFRLRAQASLNSSALSQNPLLA